MFTLTDADWINPPATYSVGDDTLVIVTDPGTDLWQRSYYGFRNDNAPCLLQAIEANFTLTVKVQFEYKNLFDQCGLAIYIDTDTWFKASVEYENQSIARLGSVVTNHGYSDWASVDIALPETIWFRLHRRGPDFLVESSADGVNFQQMRIFHLHVLGATTEAMGQANPPKAATAAVPVGLYACSPGESSFKATFSELEMEACRWQPHSAM